MIITTSASSANLGPGFDSIGMAVSLYLKVEVVEPSKTWQVDHDLPGIAHDASNLIVQSALKTSPHLEPMHLKVTSNIPLARGLGSSSSAIVAGIELANQMQHLQLTDEQKVELGSQIEGHPDNIAPTILGGLVVGSFVNGHFDTVQLPFLPYSLVAYIPHYQLSTKKSRSVLPENLSRQQAVQASAIANTFVASLAMGNYQQAGELMQADLFHEPYRQKLVPELGKIRQLGQESGALATYLSGAGSTVMTVIRQDLAADFIKKLPAHGLNDRIELLHPLKQGVQVSY
ncbi:MAG: homoserine kinase [Lactobacillus sp.]|jgi:homoserine kinase|nr:homoserine kinase [Lactobacillus sp.]MCH3906090.1 homoserine kinase [Lactobacillus sp.]MCH3990335.1 homoserine kinase [Lactobacillus sp.]MCH4068950.1 homoserine kinase [Lactobacillus sp.]MCI1303352.1 homoserine kinase [Lactobacillus sp.]